MPFNYILIVGAGFSANAGLPLASDFTESLLATSRLSARSQSAILANLLRAFVDDVFGAGAELDADEWPSLEDLFTTIDLAANTGHNLGRKYSAADLRTVRRALIVRMTRMLTRRLTDNLRTQSPAATFLAEFFRRVKVTDSAFLSMNWDTVIESGLKEQQSIRRIEYGFPTTAGMFRNSAVRVRKPTGSGVTILKPHGSVNWMYCDCCSRLLWFEPLDTNRIAARLFKESDSAFVEEIVERRPPSPVRPAVCPNCGAQALGTRLATFSYQKALDFPMHNATWRKAEDLLYDAQHWIFIGYSMPPADYQFKHLLKRMELARSEVPIVTLVTGGKDADNTIKNYRRFFGSGMIPDKNVFVDGMSANFLARLYRLGAIE